MAEQKLFGEARRKLLMNTAYEECKRFCPMPLTQLQSNLVYSMGLSEKRIAEFLRILSDIKKIEIDDTDMVKVVGDNADRSS